MINEFQLLVRERFDTLILAFQIKKLSYMIDKIVHFPYLRFRSVQYRLYPSYSLPRFTKLLNAQHIVGDLKPQEDF